MQPSCIKLVGLVAKLLMPASDTSSRNSPRARPRRAAPHGRILSTTELRSLHRIVEPDIDAVLVRRTPAPELRALATRLPDAGTCRMVPFGAGFSAQALLGRSFSEEATKALADDIERLHAMLHDIAAGAGHAQLAVTVGDECRKFHADHYRLRLLVSYVGPGTELLPEFALDRNVLCTGGDDVVEANRAIAREPSAIIRARSGDVVVLKGERYGSGLAAVHRSPPIADRSLVRLVLKMTVD
jgi:hypothetical protein